MLLRDYSPAQLTWGRSMSPRPCRAVYSSRREAVRCCQQINGLELRFGPTWVQFRAELEVSLRAIDKQLCLPPHPMLGISAEECRKKQPDIPVPSPPDVALVEQMEASSFVCTEPQGSASTMGQSKSPALSTNGMDRGAGKILVRPLMAKEMVIEFFAHSTEVLHVEEAADSRGLIVELSDRQAFLLEERCKRRRLGDVVPELELV